MKIDITKETMGVVSRRGQVGDKASFGHLLNDLEREMWKGASSGLSTPETAPRVQVSRGRGAVSTAVMQSALPPSSETPSAERSLTPLVSPDAQERGLTEQASAVVSQTADERPDQRGRHQQTGMPTPLIHLAPLANRRTQTPSPAPLSSTPPAPRFTPGQQLDAAARSSSDMRVGLLKDESGVSLAIRIASTGVATADVLARHAVAEFYRYGVTPTRVIVNGAELTATHRKHQSLDTPHGGKHGD
jgi:hypothetical protein